MIKHNIFFALKVGIRHTYMHACTHTHTHTHTRIHTYIHTYTYTYSELTSHEYGLITKEHTVMHTIQDLNWPSGFILQCLSNKTLPVVQGQNSYCKLEP